MAWTKWNWLAEFRKLWEPPLADPISHAARIFKAHRNFVLPAKLVILVIVLYYIFFSEWIAQVSEDQAAALDSLQHVTHLSLQEWAMLFLLLNVGFAALLWVTRKFPQRAIYGLVLANGVVDGLFLLAMTLVTEGFQSYLFWVFPALIVINAFSIPLAAPQIILNLLLSAFYMAGGIWHAEIVPQLRHGRKLRAPAFANRHTPKSQRPDERRWQKEKPRAHPTRLGIARSRCFRRGVHAETHCALAAHGVLLRHPSPRRAAKTD